MLTTAEANALLPDVPTQERPQPEKLNYMLIAPPKWGKTTWMCDIPNALLLAFEQGHAFQKAFKMIVDCWDKKVTEDNPAIWQEATEEGQPPGNFHCTMTKIAEVLEAADKFDFVIFDTADMAAKMCLDYYLRKHGWTHAKDGGDYGVGHDISQNTPFRQMVGRIMKTGRGVGFLTHSEVKKTDLASKKETTLPNGVYKFLHTQADIIMHGSFGIKQKGNRYRDRVIQTEGDEETLAGNRVRDLIIPARYIVDTNSPWAQWRSFFTDENAVATAEEDMRIAATNTESAAQISEGEVKTELPTGEAKPTVAPKRNKKTA